MSAVCFPLFSYFRTLLQLDTEIDKQYKTCASVIHLMVFSHIFLSRESSIQSKQTGKFALCMQQWTFELKYCLKGSSSFYIKKTDSEKFQYKHELLMKRKVFSFFSSFVLHSKVVEIFLKYKSRSKGVASFLCYP